MTSRVRLSNRRACSIFNFAYSTVDGSMRKFIGSVGFFDDGRPAELFINTPIRAGSEADCNAQDGAVAISLALQYGCPLDTLREAMKRNPDGAAQGPLGAAMDAVAAMISAPKLEE